MNNLRKHNEQIATSLLGDSTLAFEFKPKDRPLLMSGEMVRAYFAGRKTQTRRVIRPEWWRCLDPDDPDDLAKALLQCPYGQPGDRLWIRETFSQSPGRAIRYRATERDPLALYGGVTWKPSIHMRRDQSRLTLDLLKVRIEQVQSISESDARAEGVEDKFAYWKLWDVLNAARGFFWHTNPWVWVLDFPRYEQN